VAGSASPWRSRPKPAGHRRPAAGAVTAPSPRSPRSRRSGSVPRSAPAPAATAGEPPTPGPSGTVPRWPARARYPPPGPRRGHAPRPARPCPAGPIPAPSRPGGRLPSRSGQGAAPRRASLRILNLTLTSGGPQTGSLRAGPPAGRSPGRLPSSRLRIRSPRTMSPRGGGPAAGPPFGRRPRTAPRSRTRSRHKPAGPCGHRGQTGWSLRSSRCAGPGAAVAAGNS
jgi:hypothetical protein